MELKAGSVPVPVFDTMDAEVSKKWAEFENLSFGDMSAQTLIGAEAHHSSTRQPSQTVDDSQLYQSSPEEAKVSVTVSETDVSHSEVAPLPLNEAKAIKVNTSEALQREVRHNMQAPF